MQLPIASVLVFASSIALAQSPLDPPCQLSVERPISFRSATSQDKVTVAIGPGPCHSAKLNLTISTTGGKALYTYEAPFKQHVATQWDDPDLPTIALKFATEAAENGVVIKKDLPKPVSQDQITEENPFEFLVSKRTYLRLVSAGQPIFHYLTYYEGGRYIAYDPKTKKALDLIQWGL